MYAPIDYGRDIMRIDRYEYFPMRSYVNPSGFEIYEYECFESRPIGSTSQNIVRETKIKQAYKIIRRDKSNAVL